MKLFLIALSALIAFSGCGGRQREILGKWQMDGSDGTVWEFSKHGAVMLGDVRGAYTFGSDDRIKIQTHAMTAVYLMKFDNRRLTLTDADGGKLRFTKVQPSAN